MINLIQSPEVKAPVVANLQRLGLRDTPLHQRVAFMGVILAAMGLISGNADAMDGVFLFFEPVDLFIHQVGLEGSGTPANLNSRPAVSVGRYA